MKCTPHDSQEESSSRMHGLVQHFPPWEVQTHSQDQIFFDDSLYCDPTGMLQLSHLQEHVVEGWARYDVPPGSQLQKCLDPASIVQCLVEDCSVICAIITGLQWERDFGTSETDEGSGKRSFISSVLFPQSDNGRPVVSRSGKYSARLWIHGRWRKVDIDDSLPSSGDGSLLLCSHGAPGDLFVSLVEKAMMKLYGGYDFPGSAPHIDLFTMTGWLPEEVYLIKRDPDYEVWRMLHRFRETGALVASAGTPEISQPQSVVSGLWSCHCYALLKSKEVGREKLLLLKNPWGEGRWKGRYGEEGGLEDLDGEVQLAALEDGPGTFWMSFEDFYAHFKCLYLSWDPSLFPFKKQITSMFSCEGGVREQGDEYEELLPLVFPSPLCWAYKPQFLLSIPKTEGADSEDRVEVSITLSQHSTNFKDPSLLFPVGVHAFLLPHSPCLQASHVPLIPSSDEQRSKFKEDRNRSSSSSLHVKHRSFSSSPPRRKSGQEVERRHRGAQVERLEEGNETPSPLCRVFMENGGEHSGAVLLERAVLTDALHVSTKLKIPGRVREEGGWILLVVDSVRSSSDPSPSLSPLPPSSPPPPSTASSLVLSPSIYPPPHPPHSPFTLSVAATSTFSLRVVPPLSSLPSIFRTKKRGEWREGRGGGALGTRSFFKNPVFVVSFLGQSDSLKLKVLIHAAHLQSGKGEATPSLLPCVSIFSGQEKDGRIQPVSMLSAGFYCLSSSYSEYEGASPLGSAVLLVPSLLQKKVEGSFEMDIVSSVPMKKCELLEYDLENWDLDLI